MRSKIHNFVIGVRFGRPLHKREALEAVKGEVKGMYYSDLMIAPYENAGDFTIKTVKGERSDR